MTIRRICSYAITPWIIGAVVLTALICGYVATYRVCDRNNWFLESPGAARAVNINMTILMFGCGGISCTIILGFICAWMYDCACKTAHERQNNTPWSDTTAGKAALASTVFATSITVISCILTCAALCAPEQIYPNLDVERGLPHAWFRIPFLKTLLLGTYLAAALVIAAFGYVLATAFLRDLRATQEQCQKAHAD
jgi:hypothetical protein